MSYTKKHTPGPWKNTITGIKDSNNLLVAQFWNGEINIDE